MPGENLRDELEKLLRLGTDPVIVTREFLSNALRRQLAGELDENELMNWANLVEARDEIQYESGFEKVIADILFHISTPEINGPLESDVCQKYIDQLSSSS